MFWEFWALSFVFWVLGFVFGVLCFVFCVLGFGFCVLGFVFWVLEFFPNRFWLICGVIGTLPMEGLENAPETVRLEN